MDELYSELKRLLEKNKINPLYKEGTILNDPRYWRENIISKNNRHDPPKEALPNEEKLAPLDEVFIDDHLKDGIVSSLAIPELIMGTKPTNSGVILYGPPGTGKTVLLRAACEVYSRSGAYATDVSIASLNAGVVGSLSKNIETVISTALRESDKRRKPSFLSFDEASILAQKATEGSSSVSKYYQEAIDVIKRYIGNDPRLVIALATNELPESFEAAVVREGRLVPFFIGYPAVEELQKMWKYFTAKYSVLTLDDSQALRLAELTPSEQGAFVNKFCENYLAMKRNELLGEKGYPTLVSALKKGVSVSDNEVREKISFDGLYSDLEKLIGLKYQKEIKPKNHIGF